MTIAELIALARARLAYLNGRRGTAVALGDTAAIAALDGQIATTEATIAALEGLT
jgi:hypothetical protein